MALDLYAKIEPYLDLEESTYTLHKEFLRIIMEGEIDNILDIGCGRGYFLENLLVNKKNYLGIDLSTEQIKVCQEKGLNAKHNTLKEIEEKFDCATAIFDVVNFVSKKELNDFFTDIKSVLNTDGYLIFDVNTLFAFEEIAQGCINMDLDEIFITIDANFERNKLKTDFCLFEKEKDGKFTKSSNSIIQEYYKKEYLEKLLKKLDFEIVEIKELSIYSMKEADKLIYICKKK